MGKLQGKTDYENVRNARILENQARLASLGLHKAITELRSIASSAKPSESHVRDYNKKVYSLTSLRRSDRLKGITRTHTSIRRAGRLGGRSVSLTEGESDERRAVNAPLVEVKESELQISPESSAKCCKSKGKLQAITDYENVRNARILENQARLASLGLHKAITELRSITSSAKRSKTHVKDYNKKVYSLQYSLTSLRRSDRLKGITRSHTSIRRAGRLRVSLSEGESEERKPANAPLVEVKESELQISPESSAKRCKSKGRGSVYHPVFGISCHYCRQKKLCGEEDCKRCGDLDMDQPCIGKTDCSVCHSSRGVHCRGCLKVRYGEELNEVRENKEWMCPHCIEEKGVKPYWICNSSICLKKRKMVPTGIAIYRCQEMGYKSAAHMLMAELRGADKSAGNHQDDAVSIKVT